MSLVHRPFRGRPRRSDGDRPPFSLTHRAAAAALALSLAGCASVSPDGGERDVQALVARNPIVGDATPRRAPDDASHQAVDALLAQPLDAQAAVRIALAHGPRMQEAFATLRKASSHLNRKISSIARELVEAERANPTPPAP